MSTDERVRRKTSRPGGRSRSAGTTGRQETRAAGVLLGLFALLGLGAAPAGAQSLAGAEVAPVGRVAMAVDFGVDLPQTGLYSVGVQYGVAENVQVGADLSTWILANSLGLSTRGVLHRSPDDRFLVSAQGTIRGLYALVGEGLGLAETALLVLEPRLLSEWRPLEDGRWALFVELGTQHYFGHADGRLLLNGGDEGTNRWGHAFRAALGTRFQLAETWWIHGRGGVWGAPREPGGLLTAGFTKQFR